MLCPLKVLTLLFLCFLVYEVLQGCKCVLVCVCLQSAYVLLHRKFAADWYPCSLRSPCQACPPQTRYWRQRHGASRQSLRTARQYSSHAEKTASKWNIWDVHPVSRKNLYRSKLWKEVNSDFITVLLFRFCFVLISSGGLVWSGLVTRMWYVRWYLGADTERGSGGQRDEGPRQTRQGEGECTPRWITGTSLGSRMEQRPPEKWELMFSPEKNEVRLNFTFS